MKQSGDVIALDFVKICAHDYFIGVDVKDGCENPETDHDVD